MYARTFGPLIAFATFIAASPAAHAACSADATASADAGRWTSGQLSMSKAAILAVAAGMRCSGADLAPGAAAQVTATIRSANGFELRQAGVDSGIGYVASADREGARPIPQGGTIDFAAAALRHPSATDAAVDIPMPISFQSFRGHRLPAGRYSDVLTIEWRWRTCRDFDVALSLCKAHVDGIATTSLRLSMEVDARPPVVTMTVKTVTGMVTRDGFPASPMSRRIITVAVNNPDVVAIDPDSIVLDVPIDRRMLIADHEDGQPKAIEVVRGAEDGMSVSYRGLRDAADDVECTMDGKDWTLQPADPSQIRSVRIRVRGTLQPGKSVMVALTGAAVEP